MFLLELDKQSCFLFDAVMASFLFGFVRTCKKQSVKTLAFEDVFAMHSVSQRINSVEAE